MFGGGLFALFLGAALVASTGPTELPRVVTCIIGIPLIVVINLPGLLLSAALSARASSALRAVAYTGWFLLPLLQARVGSSRMAAMVGTGFVLPVFVGASLAWGAGWAVASLAVLNGHGRGAGHG